MSACPCIKTSSREPLIFQPRLLASAHEVTEHDHAAIETYESTSHRQHAYRFLASRTCCHNTTSKQSSRKIHCEATASAWTFFESPQLIGYHGRMIIRGREPHSWATSHLIASLHKLTSTQNCNSVTQEGSTIIDWPLQLFALVQHTLWCFGGSFIGIQDPHHNRQRCLRPMAQPFHRKPAKSLTRARASLSTLLEAMT